MRKVFVLCLAALCVAVFPAAAQRRPVLSQIDEPHPYYYRELYLPQLTSGPSSLSWMPDSEYLVFSMAGSLWRQSLYSTEAKQLTDGPGYDYEPDVSPDGKSIVFVKHDKDALELWLLDLASGKITPLTTSGAVNIEPRWSPDGKQLVWVSTQFNKRFHIFVADLKDGALANVRRLTGEAKSPLPRYYYSAYDMEINPTWTRDGKEILYVSNRGHIHGTGGFWRIALTPGAEPRELHYEETNWKARPEISPDGSRMVYSSYLGRQWHNLWLMPANGGDAFPLSYADFDQTNARWSPDGKKIAYISNEGGNTRINYVTIPGAEKRELETVKYVYLRDRTPLHLSITNAKGVPVAARVSLEAADGRHFAPADSWVYADDAFDPSLRPGPIHYFHSRGNSVLDLPPGEYVLRASKGFESQPVAQKLTIKPGEPVHLHVMLFPLAQDFAAGNWHSADTHTHMNYGGTYRNDWDHLAVQAGAEGLESVFEQTVNKEQRYPDAGFVRFDSNAEQKRERKLDWRQVQSQEFHTSYWGHRGVLGIKDHLILPGYAGYPNTAAASLFPMNADVYDLAHEQGALVGAVHPFEEVPAPLAHPEQRLTDELPIDVAIGKLDYLEVVGFSDHISTAEVWYKLLNLGFHLPASAGTDATANYASPIRGMVGQDRVFIYAPGDSPIRSELMDGIRQGKTFVSNGPLVEFTLGGQMIGSELTFSGPQTAVPYTAKLRSIVSVDHLQIVCNGEIAMDLPLDANRTSATANGTLAIPTSGWCVLRAFSEKPIYPVMDAYNYATTSPVYVSIAGKRAYSRKDAEYFLAWIDRVRETTEKYPDWNSPDEKALVLKRIAEARKVFADMH